jgi:hypothetical protein
MKIFSYEKNYVLKNPTVKSPKKAPKKEENKTWEKVKSTILAYYIIKYSNL